MSLWTPNAIAAYCNQGRSGTTLLDSGPFKRHATLNGEGEWSQIDGHKERWALHTGGTTLGTISVDPSVWFPNGPEITVTAWIAPSFYGGEFQSICGIRNQGGFYFRLNNGSIAAAAVASFSDAGETRTVPLPGGFANQWWHIAIRFFAGTLSIYWQGALIHSSSTAFGMPDSGARMVLWGTPVGGNNVSPLSGKGADLCFWQYLSDDEIAWLANPKHNVLQVPSARRGFSMSRLVN